MTDSNTTTNADKATSPSFQQRQDEAINDPGVVAYYQDKYLTIKDGVLTIRWYYFPAGTKHIRLDQVQSVTRHKMEGPCSGRGRLWGGSLIHWLNLDTHRRQKDFLYELHLVKTWFPTPTVTPDDPQRFQEALQQFGLEIIKSDSTILV